MHCQVRSQQVFRVKKNLWGCHPNSNYLLAFVVLCKVRIARKERKEKIERGPCITASNVLAVMVPKQLL